MLHRETGIPIGLLQESYRPNVVAADKTSKDRKTGTERVELSSFPAKRIRHVSVAHARDATNLGDLEFRSEIKSLEARSRST